MVIYYSGTFQASGGLGGVQAEHGGAGTVYHHRLPPPAGINNNFANNRTLFIGNAGHKPRDVLRNLTLFYADYPLGSATTWVLPASYPALVPLVQARTTDVILEELQLVGGGHMAFVNPADPTGRMNVHIGSTDGDRSGKLHIGYNQTLTIGTGRLPADLSIYRGGQITLTGELRVAGVTVTIEGVLSNVENLTVVDRG